MKEIKTDADLQSAIQQLYDATREAMTDRIGQWRKLEISFAHICKIAKLNGIQVDPLPIPKSIVQGAPVITTKATEAPKPITPAPPVAGDVLADNAPRPKKRTSSRRRKSE